MEVGVIGFCDEHRIDMALSTCVTSRLVSRTVRLRQQLLQSKSVMVGFIFKIFLVFIG